ncbi:multicopy suppressor of BFA (Brefeldin A) [Coemansia sp. RSA 1646]|nr:multicopy suppressor of BFA (Brefeldin A) [Coemansia sp. RSA 1646]KAJ2087731.1 multicopy suppressor of BFA (Brefeldin A) [Coemansia sp. RSA 986]
MAPDSTVKDVAAGTRESVAERRPRPSRPEQDKHKKELAAIDAKIDALRKQQEDIRHELSKSDPHKGPHVNRRNKLVARLQEIRTEQNKLRKSRGSVFDKQAALTASISKKTGDLKAQQAKLTYKSVEEINELIGKSQKRIDDGGLKLVEERRLEDKISGLRRAKKHVEQAEALQGAIDADVAMLTEVDAQLADTNAQALSDEYAALNAELDALKAKQDEGGQTRGGLLSERSRIMRELDQAWDEKRAAQDEFRRQNNEFFQWQQEDRKRKAAEDKQHRIREQRERRLAMAQEQREEAEVPAYQNEIDGCDALLHYLRGMAPSPIGGTGSRSESSTRPPSVASNTRDADTASDHVPAGMVAVKKVSNEESYFVGVTSTKGKKKHGRKDRRPGSKGEALKHPLSVAERFLELQVDIPTTSAAIPATIEQLDARKRHFIENQDKATLENKQKAEERIAKLMAELEVDEKIAEEA